MEQRDRYGNWINDQTYRKLCQYAIRLKKLGYQEANQKPNLFYYSRGLEFEGNIGTVTYFMDMRGTGFKKIWEDSRPAFGWTFDCEMPKWAKRRRLQDERERFLEHNIPFRIAHLNEVHPDDTETITMPFSWPNGYCQTCGTDMRADGKYCSAACERDAVPDRFCETCNARLSHDERIRHHVSYFPEETVVVCRSCHTKLHRNQDFYPELTPPDDAVREFYEK